jgi:FKBP-type peptidyl-prolyl cis-trans isomerase FklB
MHRSHRHLLSSATACLLALCAPLAASADAAPSAEPEATAPSYSAGLQVGEGMHRAGISTELDIDAFTRGLKDALAGKISTPADKERLSVLIAAVRTNTVARNHAAARDFLAKNAAAKGVVTTASGLQYKIIQSGNPKAPSPALTDKVTVQYRGTLIDGTEFDSSYARGTPATVSVNGVIEGWQEALVLMKPGAKWQLFIPPGLAYDENSRPPIPPGSLLVFEVELVRIGGADE